MTTPITTTTAPLAQVEIDQNCQGQWQRTGIGPEPLDVAERRAALWAERNPQHRYRVTFAPARPVLPGEATPPPAPSHGEAAPDLPRLRADAAAGHPVSLAALARAMAEDLLTPSPSPVSLAALRPEA